MSKEVIGLDIETVDTLGYFPENCRWVSMIIQRKRT